MNPRTLTRSFLFALTLCAFLEAPAQTFEVVDESTLVSGSVAFTPSDPTAIYRVALDGQILRRTQSQHTTFLDISSKVNRDGEGGLLSVAFDPRYETNRFLYLAYTDRDNSGGMRLVISRFRANLDRKSASRASERILLRIPRPQTNHVGGWIGFRPGQSNLLYIASGDGGNFNDTGTGHIEPGGNAQNRNTLLGKILRLNVRSDDFPADNQKNYAIPADNPFADGGGFPEIWAFGLRNPYRCSFDRVTGDFWIADVGQSTREEINLERASSPGGRNYGWRPREGKVQTPGLNEARPNKAINPIFDYGRDRGFCVIGGYRYRGSAIPSLRGRYLFADLNGSIYALDLSSKPVRSVNLTSALPRSSVVPISWGEDTAGELYLTDSTGRLFKLVP